MTWSNNHWLLEQPDSEKIMDAVRNIAIKKDLKLTKQLLNVIKEERPKKVQFLQAAKNWNELSIRQAIHTNYKPLVRKNKHLQVRNKKMNNWFFFLLP